MISRKIAGETVEADRRQRGISEACVGDEGELRPCQDMLNSRPDQELSQLILSTRSSRSADVNKHITFCLKTKLIH